MVSVQQALEITLNETPLPGTEEVLLTEARNCVLAEDVYSDIDMPPFNKSAMDGYAVKASDCQETSVVLDVIGTIPAGVNPQFTVQHAQAAKIMTGAPLPQGADSVQMVEKTEAVDSGKVKILESVQLGQNVARKSEIIAKDSRIMQKGVYISPAVIGVLATAGKERIATYKRPQVGILVTGDELVDVGRQPQAGQIRNSNGYALYSQVSEMGAHSVALGLASDDIKSLSGKIARGLKYDVLLVSGGVSMGDFDLVEDVFSEQGVEIFYDKVNIKPGKPTVFGRVRQTLVFGLPGNPVSASTVFEVLVRPALRKLMGFRQLHHLSVSAILGQDFTVKTKRENYQPALTVFEEDHFHAVPIASKGSADVVAFARSNSYIVTAQEKREFGRGDAVRVLLRDDFWRDKPATGV